MAKRKLKPQLQRLPTSQPRVEPGTPVFRTGIETAFRTAAEEAVVTAGNAGAAVTGTNRRGQAMEIASDGTPKPVSSKTPNRHSLSGKS